MKKKIAAFIVALMMTLPLVIPTQAAETMPLLSWNAGQQNYDTWSRTVKSYLYENSSGGLTRVEYANNILIAEEYDSSFQLKSTRELPVELPLWGGFFAGNAYNFLIFGQQNPSEDNNLEVIRIVKYSKNWERLEQASVTGANTTVPFDAGSLRCAEQDGVLYVRTCHKMYKSSDGLNHQANMTVMVRQNDMSVTDVHYGILVSQFGYSSHSFNQFILVDADSNLVAVDHGDAYPRAIVLSRGAITSNGLPRSSETDIVTFPGATGNNTTGASLGGLAETTSGYVTAFNYDGQGGGGTRSVYLGYTQKSDLSSRVIKLDTPDGITVTTPVLASAGLEGGYILWTGKADNADTILYYASYADDGAVGAVQTANAVLSDCQPVCYQDKAVWYVTDGEKLTFYSLDASGLSESEQPLSTDLIIGEGIASISMYAYQNCKTITSVTFPESLKEIGWGAFSGCSSLTSVKFPKENNLTTIACSAFRNCESLKSIAIPDGVQKIDEWTFGGCQALTDVTIPASVSSIDYCAFYGCTNLKNIYYSGDKAQWENIEIGSFNEQLKNEIIHFQSDEPVEEPGDFSVSLSDDNPAIVEISNPGTLFDHGAIIFAAQYDTDGRMIGIAAGELQTNHIIKFNHALASGWKLFFLDTHYTPLCGAVILQS